MNFREAQIEDIEQCHIVRNAVTENTLSNPNLISYDDYVEFLTQRGKGWVCEVEKQIVGFAIADWYFTTGKDRVWLGTSPNTRAAEFYRKSGWTETGVNGEKEIKFEITKESWTNKKSLPSFRQGFSNINR